MKKCKTRLHGFTQRKNHQRLIQITDKIRISTFDDFWYNGKRK
nr:MAG TPA: hypothetical protein [Caudoviricetes sp.]